MVWLSSLGANALASWLDQWAQGKLGSLNRADPDAEHRLLEQCASALTIALSADKALADDIELVVQSTGAIKTTLEALEDQGEDQARLLNNLLADLLSLSVENRHLHQALLQAVHDQARSILATQAQGDAALATKLQEILAATQSAQRPAPTTGALPRLQPKEISAQVVQHIAISGGSVGSVIGKQINHHTPSSPQADESASPGSDHAE
jgi:Rad3-related DNA helicase